MVGRPMPGVPGNCTYKMVAGTGWVKQTGDTACTSGPTAAAPDGTIVEIKCSTGTLVSINGGPSGPGGPGTGGGAGGPGGGP